MQAVFPQDIQCYPWHMQYYPLYLLFSIYKKQYSLYTHGNITRKAYLFFIVAGLLFYPVLYTHSKVSRELFFSTIYRYSYLFYSCYSTLHGVETMCIYSEFWSVSSFCSTGVHSHWPRSLSSSNVAVFSDGGEMIFTTVSVCCVVVDQCA